MGGINLFNVYPPYSKCCKILLAKGIWILTSLFNKNQLFATDRVLLSSEWESQMCESGEEGSNNVTDRTKSYLNLKVNSGHMTLLVVHIYFFYIFLFSL